MSVVTWYNSPTIILVIKIVWKKNSKVVGSPIIYIVYCALSSTLHPNLAVANKTYNKNRDEIIAENCHDKFF